MDDFDTFSGRVRYYEDKGYCRSEAIYMAEVDFEEEEDWYDDDDDDDDDWF